MSDVKNDVSDKQSKALAKLFFDHFDELVHAGALSRLSGGEICIVRMFCQWLCQDQWPQLGHEIVEPREDEYTVCSELAYCQKCGGKEEDLLEPCQGKP